MRPFVRRDETVFLEDIVECCRDIEQFTEGFSLEQFRRDKKTIASVIRSFEVIGEATKHVTGATRAKMPDVEWQRMAGLRDVLIHNYPGINIETLWDIVQTKVFPLRTAIEDFLRGR